MASFDFKEYLSRIDPENSYTILPLTGGLVNVTVRAVKAPCPQIDKGKFASHQSIVLKFAPPYFAKQGERAPFSEFRQTIEARALPLFAHPNGELLSLCNNWDIKVPELLHHDPESHILILADLGELDTLTEQLTRLTPIGNEILGNPQAYTELGIRLGGFFAELHSSSALELLGHKRSTYFDNPDVKDAIYDNIIVPIRQRLNDFGIPDAEDLYRRITEDHLRPDEPWEQNFMIGDLWTGSILLDWPRIYVIDWEFAGIGRGVSVDMAIFLAQLHLHLFASPTGSSAQVALQALIQTTVGEYRRQRSRMKSVDLLEEAAKMDGTPIASLSIENLMVIRSAFIVHGRKIINNAIERDWHCDCCKQKFTEKKGCRLVVRMVELGVWYLRKAAADLEEFALDANWSEILKKEGKVILGMFLDD